MLKPVRSFALIPGRSPRLFFGGCILHAFVAADNPKVSARLSKARSRWMVVLSESIWQSKAGIDDLVQVERARTNNRATTGLVAYGKTLCTLPVRCQDKAPGRLWQPICGAIQRSRKTTISRLFWTPTMTIAMPIILPPIAAGAWSTDGDENREPAFGLGR